MIDPRFYLTKPALTLSMLAKSSGCSIHTGNPELKIKTISALHELCDGGLAFIRDYRQIPQIDPVGGVAIASQDTISKLAHWPVAFLEHQNPEFAFSLSAKQIVCERYSQDKSQRIAKSATLGDRVTLSPGVVIGDHVQIGDDTCIGANVTIGCGVHIGKNCEIGSGAHLGFCDLQDRVMIMAGAVIGSLGLGVAFGGELLASIPHFGSVLIESDVRIGANTTIDRGVFQHTKIGRGTKIDNLIQIAHNVEIGSNCVLAAQVGISGSVIIGDRVLMGGKVGITDHRQIGNDVTIAADSAVMNDIPSGETWSGSPAQFHRSHLKELLAVRKLVKKSKRNS